MKLRPMEKKKQDPGRTAVHTHSERATICVFSGEADFAPARSDAVPVRAKCEERARGRGRLRELGWQGGPFGGRSSVKIA